MKLAAIALASLLAASGALAQSTSGSTSASTATVAPGTINSPLVNIGGTTQQPYTAADVRHTTNQAATTGTVFVNPPASGTCATAGSGLALQAVGGGAAVSIGGGASETCEAREDVVNLKWSGAPAEVVKARQCMVPAMAEAWARAGIPCVDLRTQAQPTAAGPALAQQPKPWMAGG